MPLIPIIITHILLLSLTRYIAWPENFVWAYLNSQGLALYKDIFFIYPPLYFLLLDSFYKIAGISLSSLQVFSYLIIAVTDVLLFFAAKKKIWPVIIYVLLQIPFEGNGMWPDQLLAPFFLTAYICLQNKKYWLLGSFLGLSLITKQTAAYFVWGIILLSKNFKKTVAGIIIILFFLILYLLWNQNLRQFWEQTVVYIFSYHAKNSLQILWPNKQQIIILLLIFSPVIFAKKSKLTFLTILASLGIFTRFGYFHLQPALPFLALLVAESKINVLVLPAALFFFKVIFTTFCVEPKFLTQEILNNAKIINQYLRPGEKTLILTPSDHYYWLTKTKPVGNFFTTSTPWNLDYPNIQEKIIKDLIINKPKFVVIDDQTNKITNFVKRNYHLVLKLSDGSGIFEDNPVSVP